MGGCTAVTAWLVEAEKRSEQPQHPLKGPKLRKSSAKFGYQHIGRALPTAWAKERSLMKKLAIAVVAVCGVLQQPRARPDRATVGFASALMARRPVALGKHNPV